MKTLVSLAAALLFSVSAFATEEAQSIQNQNIELSVDEVSNFADQTLSFTYPTTKVNVPVYANFTLTNNGPIPVMIHKIAVVGVDFAGFYACPSVMPAHTKCLVRTAFKPWSPGMKTGNLIIFGQDGVLTINLSGLGVR